MGTNFYWRDQYREDPEEISDDLKVEMLRDTIQKFLGGDENMRGLQEVMNNTAPPAEIEDEDDFDVPAHIGKRSAAGWWCYSCGVTLCIGGKENVHSGYADWYKNCPKCKRPKNQENLGDGAAGVELGFASPRVEKPSGVSSCSSFSWAQEPDRVLAICQERPDEEIVVDEYGRALTGRAFAEMLAVNCPIQSTRSVGKDFC